MTLHKSTATFAAFVAFAGWLLCAGLAQTNTQPAHPPEEEPFPEPFPGTDGIFPNERHVHIGAGPDSSSHLRTASEPISTKSLDGLAGIRRNSVRPRKDPALSVLHHSPEHIPRLSREAARKTHARSPMPRQLSF